MTILGDSLIKGEKYGKKEKNHRNHSGAAE